MRRSILLALTVVLAAAGCATRNWERVRAEDTPAAYRRFLDEHAGSPHAAEARERLDFLQAKREGTPAALDRFRADHPSSPYLADLEGLAEGREFEAARAVGTPEAYDRFADRFPGREIAERARGNAEYLRQQGFGGRPAELSAFAKRYPSSDYAAEALRTLSLLQLRGSGGFRAVGLQIEIAPEVADADRLRNTFTERAQDAYAAAGVSLLAGNRASGGWIEIQHGERPVPTQVYNGQVAGPGVLAETHISLHRSGQDEPIWTQTFTLRVPDVERRKGGSVLFSASAGAYWSHFFVPVATWPTQAARRAPLPMRGGVVGVAAELDRAVALYGDGSFREIDLADPDSPRGVADYKRPAGLARYSGLRLLPHHVVVYGEDGVDVVARGAAPKRLWALGREQVGAVVAVEEVGGQLLLAGSRGLLRTPLAGGPVEKLVPKALRGIGFAGGTLYALDDRMLYAAPLADPRAERFESAFEVGRALEPTKLRVTGGSGVVIGRKGVICLDLGHAAVAQLARFDAKELGQLSDAAMVGGRLFAVGERGLQVLDTRSGRLLDSVDVEGRFAVDAAGRHVVVIGSDRLQVVDATPWSGLAAAASIAPPR